MNKQLRTDILLMSWDTFTISAVSRINIYMHIISGRHTLCHSAIVCTISLGKCTKSRAWSTYLYLRRTRLRRNISSIFGHQIVFFFVTTYQLVSLLYFLLPKNWNVQSWWQNNEKSGFNTFLRIHCSVRLFTNLRYRVVAQYICVYIFPHKKYWTFQCCSSQPTIS